MKRTLLAAAIAICTFGGATPARADDLQHLQQLLSTGECMFCNLAGAGLVRADLRQAQLRGVDLRDANLSRADLRGADLRGADLSGASLFGANLRGANLSGATFDGTDLREADLVAADLSEVDLATAYLQGTIGLPSSSMTPQRFYRLGVTETEKGDYRAAIAYYQRAIEIEAEYAPAYLGRAIAYYRLGNSAEAARDAKVASTFFKLQENAEGIQAAGQMLVLIEVAELPPEMRGTEAQPGNAIMGIASMLLRFLL